MLAQKSHSEERKTSKLFLLSGFHFSHFIIAASHSSARIASSMHAKWDRFHVSSHPPGKMASGNYVVGVCCAFLPFSHSSSAAAAYSVGKYYANHGESYFAPLCHIRPIFKSLLRHVEWRTLIHSLSPETCEIPYGSQNTKDTPKIMGRISWM